MAVEVEHSTQGAEQGHTQQTKHLEVDPHLLRQIEGDIGVEQGADEKEEGPSQVDSPPDDIWQLHLFSQHLLDERLLEAELADQQGNREDEVDNRHLPLDEGIIMEKQGEAAEH